MTAALTRDLPVLGAAQWRARQREHERRVDGWLGDHLAKRSGHGRDSIEEFLFTYYSYRPAQLRRWHPGQGVALAGATAEDFGPRYAVGEDGLLRLDVAAILARRRASVEWIHRLLTATAGRPAHLGCFGMHEWAMVYRQEQDEVRHNSLPLRLPPGRIASVVDETKIWCSHFDAFRFFTPAARPLNLSRPTRETQVDNEQPGCLHANMDVYRWAYKLAPLTPSELVADCFALAGEIRTLDMRASPYDVSRIGLDPLLVETAQGRAEYVRWQREFAARSAGLRARLISVCEASLAD